MLIALCVSNSLHAQVADPVTQRLADVCALINGTLTDLQGTFAPVFLAAVSPEQLKMGVQQITSTTGACFSTSVKSRPTSYTAMAEVITVHRFSIPISMSVEEKPPHKINGLRLMPPVKLVASFDAVINDLGAQEGQTSLCVVDLDNNTTIAQKDTNRYQPIGSTFKLYILGELARSIQSRVHRWDEVTSLQDKYMSLPSGELQKWPVESPLTLHTLACMMISKSDNTATDHLLFYLGRQHVEAMLTPMGHSKPALNKPFLSTLEMFKLKFTNQGEPAKNYAKKTESDRRTMLEALTSVSRDSVHFISEPILPDTVEWFATTADLCRAMRYLYTAAQTPAQAPLLGILGINRGLDIDKEAWPVVGFKGGSETGVINLTYLLERKDGRHFAMSASWMRTDTEVDQEAFTALVGGAIRVLASVE